MACMFFVVAEIAFKVAVITSLVVYITFKVADISLFCSVEVACPSGMS